MKRLAFVGLVLLLESAPLWADIVVRNAQATIVFQYSSGTLAAPDSKLPFEVRLFLVYLIQLAPEFKQALDARK